MLRYLLVPLWLLPVGWCDPEGRGRIWKNRRGGRVVFFGDVVGNLGEAARMVAFRLPEGTEIVRGPDGRTVGTLNKVVRNRRR